MRFFAKTYHPCGHTTEGMTRLTASVMAMALQADAMADATGRFAEAARVLHRVICAHDIRKRKRKHARQRRRARISRRGF